MKYGCDDKWEVLTIRSYGRTTIKVHYTEEQLLSYDIKTQNEIIKKIIQNTKSIHDYNKMVTRYLKAYYRGVQDVLHKEKFTRTEINNKVVENWAYAFVDFKKCYLLGKPIQYVQLNDSGEKEISILNKFVRYEQKKAKDLDIYEDVLVCGRGFRYTNFDKAEEDDEAPFEILNVDCEKAEVVYSNGLGEKQLFSYICEDMQNTIEVKNGNKVEYKNKLYNEYTVYLRNRKVVFSDANGTLEVVPDSDETIALNDHIITEYYTNRDRISLIEIGKDLFDSINNLESLDQDDFESYVNAIMIFTNASIDEDGLKEMKSLGAVCISSTEGRPASIDMLQQRLNATDTQTYYTRLIVALHQILGIPMASDSGTVTSGDTGRAKLTGQGYTMAGIRAEGEETAFEMCDMKALRKILKICKETAGSGISSLKVSEVEAKFQRDMSENLLVKTQALMNLYSADIPRKYANAIIGLFGDANAITEEQERLFGKQISQQNVGTSSGFDNAETDNNGKNTTNANDVATQQEKKLVNINEKNEQGSD